MYSNSDHFGHKFPKRCKVAMVNEIIRGLMTVNDCVLAIFLLGVVWSDLMRRKVLNGWVIVFFSIGIGIGQVEFLVPFSVMLGIGFLLYLFGLLSAGDAKVMSMIVGYLGMEQGVEALAWGFGVGGIWALFLGICYYGFKEKIYHFFAYLRQMIQTKQLVPYEPEQLQQKETVPLAACFAVGVLISL